MQFTIFNKSSLPGILNNSFTASVKDGRGNLWAVTQQRGIVRYSKEDFCNYAAGRGARINWIGKDGCGNAMSLLPEVRAIHFVDGEFSPFHLQAEFFEAARAGGKQSIRGFCPRTK